MPDHRRRSRSNSSDRRHRTDRNSYERSRHRKSKSRSPDRQYGVSDYNRRRKQRRSSSKSRERDIYRQKNEKSQEQIRQEMEQKIRLAVRNGNFQSDPDIQRIASSMPREKIQTLFDQAMRPSFANQPILVRELFIGGLSQMNQGFIHSIMQGYGMIQSVEICKSFAFVKFYKVEDASNACADYHSINLRIHHSQNPNFKMFFADHLKRWNVVSNNTEYQVKDHLIPVIYASVRNDPKYANEQYLHSLFAKFGSIRTLSIKQNQSPGPKVYVLVEYQTLEMALRARQKMQQMREKLGDRRSEITILLDSNKVTKNYPNVANQLKYIKKGTRPSGFAAPMQSSIPQHNINSINIEQNHFEADPAVYDLLIKMAQEQNNDAEVDWSGYFVRNNKLKVAVDLKLATRTQIDFRQYHLNISHRAELVPQIFTDIPILVGRFKAANGSNASLFQNYIKYFQERNRAGIIHSSNYLIYLIPPDVGPNHQYPIAKNELLALFFKPMI